MFDLYLKLFLVLNVAYCAKCSIITFAHYWRSTTYMFSDSIIIISITEYNELAIMVITALGRLPIYDILYITICRSYENRSLI